MSIFIFICVGLQEDPVLLVPEDTEQKPYVAIIKVIALLDITVLVSLFSRDFFNRFPLQIMELLSIDRTLVRQKMGALWLLVSGFIALKKLREKVAEAGNHVILESFSIASIAMTFQQNL